MSSLKGGRPTAGELAKKISADTTRYDALEIGYALSEDVLKHLWQCVDVHKNIINEPEFCVVMVLADDPLIKGVMRRKFYAWPYLPKPRPRQACFLYRRAQEDLIRLWTLPEAYCMAALSTMITVDKRWREMKGWCDAFYAGKFFDHIRKRAHINLQSESEYLEANRQKLIEAGCKRFDSFLPQPFDASEIAIKKIVDTGAPFLKKNTLDDRRET